MTTRPGRATAHSARLDELIDVMDASRAWGLDRPLVHIIDREADSVWHDRRWQAAGHQFVVRADDQRLVRRRGVEHRLPEVAQPLLTEKAFVDTGQTIDYKGAAGRLLVAETTIVMDRPAKRTTVAPPGLQGTCSFEVTLICDSRITKIAQMSDF